MKAVSKERIVELAMEAGFEEWSMEYLSGKSQDDELVYIGEYPCGEELLKFAELLIEEAGRKRPDANAVTVLLALLKGGSWFHSAIELDDGVDGEELREQALRACMLPEDWSPDEDTERSS